MIKRSPSYLLMFIICVVHIIPFFILFNLATKSPEDTTSKWLPATYIYLDNFKNAWANAFLDQALLKMS
jgi:raffinose/stachyose/melibiose transport system permease protein